MIVYQLFVSVFTIIFLDNFYCFNVMILKYKKYYFNKLLIKKYYAQTQKKSSY